MQPLILHQFQRPTVTPSDTGRIRRDPTEIALEWKSCFSLDEKRFVRARSPAENAHVVRMAVDLNLIFGSAGSIHKRTGYYRKEYIALMEDANACPPGIDIGHMVERASDFAMAAARTLGVVNQYFGHVVISWVSANAIRCFGALSCSLPGSRPMAQG